MDKLGRGLCILMQCVCAMLAAALTIVVFLQVFYRFVLRAPLVWSEEMALFLFQWLVFMGAALAVKDRGHFGLDILVRKFPKPMIKKLDKFSQMIIFSVAIGMVYWGLMLAKMTMLQTYATLNFPVGYSHFAIVVSGAFMAIFAVLNEIEDWNNRRGAGL